MSPFIQITTDMINSNCRNNQDNFDYHSIANSIMSFALFLIKICLGPIAIVLLLTFKTKPIFHSRPFLLDLINNINIYV